MAIVIGAILAISLALYIYRTWRRYIDPGSNSNPVIARLFGANGNGFGLRPTRQRPPAGLIPHDALRSGDVS